jgi:hypothetical protein
MYIRALVMLLMQPVCLAMLFVRTALEMPKLLCEPESGLLWRFWG